MNETFAVVLAAGKGTRMKSDLAKVLHEMAGEPLLTHVLRALGPVGCDRIAVVVGHQADAVGSIVTDERSECVLQSEQLGTGHAVDMARAALQGNDGVTLVLCGDVPLLQTKTIEQLVAHTRETKSAATVLSAIAEDATGYGRVLRSEAGQVIAIVEEKDATDEQRTVREYNTGTWCFDNAKLWGVLDRLDRNNAQGEYYLTDVVELFVADGERVEAVVCEDEREVQGVNTIADLENATADYATMRSGEGS